MTASYLLLHQLIVHPLPLEINRKYSINRVRIKPFLLSIKKISPLDFQSQTKVSNEIKCNFLKTSYFFVGQYEMQTFPIIEILRDSKKRFFSSISCPSLPRGIHIISNVLLMLFQSMAISFLQTGSLWPLMRTSAVPPEWSIIALVIQIPAVTAMGGGQRSFGTFLKIHPFW